MSLPHPLSQPTALYSGGLRCSHSHTSTLLDQGLIQLRVKETGGKDHPRHRRVAMYAMVCLKHFWVPQVLGVALSCDHFG